VKIRVRGTIAEAERRRLGFDSEPYLTGATTVEAEYTTAGDGASELRASADLARTVLDLPALGWRKESGAPGTATVSARRDRDGAWTIDQLELEAGDLDARGDGRFTVAPFLVERARLDRLVFPGGDLRGEAVRADDGGYRVAIEGDRFDAGPVLTALGGSAGSERSDRTSSPAAPADESATIALEVALGSLGLGGTRTLSDVEGSAVLEGGAVRSLAAGGRMDPEGVVRVELGAAAEGVRLRLETDALGRALELFQGTSEIAGGQAWVEASGPSFEGPFEGTFSATDLTVVDHPILARILSLGSLEGLFTAFGKSGIAIRSIDGALRLDEGRLEIAGLRAVGPTMLLKLDGAADLATSALDFEGMVTRNGPVKRLVGRIPVLKWLLEASPTTIAARFHVQGTLEEPEVRAQALSSLTPELGHDVLELLSPRSKR
jgi:hypothetical protein